MIKMSKLIFILGCITLILSCSPAIDTADKGGLPRELELCPDLPQSAQYVVGYYHTTGNIVHLIACKEYRWDTVLLNDTPYQKVIWIETGYYWIWGHPTDTQDIDSWWEITGIQMIGQPVIIYNNLRKPIWNLWDNDYPLINRRFSQ